jgi:hypothetical protein
MNESAISDIGSPGVNCVLPISREHLPSTSKETLNAKMKEMIVYVRESFILLYFLFLSIFRNDCGYE